MRLNLYKTGPTSCLALAIGVTAINITEMTNDFAQVDLENIDDGYMDENLHMLTQTYGESASSPMADDSDSDSDDDDDSDSDKVDVVGLPKSIGNRSSGQGQ